MTPLEERRTRLFSVATFRVPVPGWLVRAALAPVAARILRQEHRLYPLVVRWFAEGRLSVSGSRVAVAGVPEGATLLFSPEP